MKYFIVSDIHSFYNEFIATLKKAGYRKSRKDHHLIVLGDVFDRGPDTKKVYEFLKSLSKSKLTLVKGNHEELYLDLLHKDFPDSYDWSNGTVKTFCHIANIPEKKLKWSPNGDPYEVWQIVKRKVKDSEITKWIKSNRWKDYVEFDKYIGVHSFIPTKLKSEFNKFSYYGFDLSEKAYEYYVNWRTEASKHDWYEARWGCPWRQYQAGLFKPENDLGKTLICGHWHAYDFRMHLGHEVYKKKEDINFASYISDEIIAIDACTAYSKKMNVLVIDQNEVLNYIGDSRG